MDIFTNAIAAGQGLATALPTQNRKGVIIVDITKPNA